MSIFGRKRDARDADLDEEIRSHLARGGGDRVARGESPRDAAAASRREFGNVAHIAEVTRETWRGAALDRFAQDVRYAWRGLRRAPAFAITAILTLALGIGATTVIFSVVDHVVLRPLGFAEIDRLMVARIVSRSTSDPSGTVPANGRHMLAWQERCGGCDGVGIVRGMGLTISGADGPERIGAARVSPSLFSVLGARPQLGRLFREDENEPGRDHVVVLSDAFWRRRFGADPNAIGKTMMLNDISVEIVGVLPRDFRFPKRSELGGFAPLPKQTDIFKPLALAPFERTSPGGYDFGVIVRSKPGTTREQLRAQLDAINIDVARAAPRGASTEPGHTVLVPLQTSVVGPVARALLLLLAAVGAVLLIVCVNLANLMLARNATRARESAIRVALGAGRGRLVRQALTECAILATLGGATGMLLSRWGLRLLLALAPASLPRLDEVRLDVRVLATAMLVSLVAGLAFGVFPALRFGGADPGDVLKATGDRATTEGRRGVRRRSLFIASQVGISTVLLVAAGLFLASFVRVLRVDRGFSEEQVLTIDIVPPRAYAASPEARNQLLAAAMQALAALPGVRATAIASKLPLSGEAEVNELRTPEERGMRISRDRMGNVRFVSPGYFSSLGMPVRRGRPFADSDRGRDVTIISEHAADVLWPGEDPIGKHVMAYDEAPAAEVIGVVADTRTTSLERDASLIAYYPYWIARAPSTTSILVQTSGDPAAMSGAVRATLRRIAPDVPVAQLRTMREIVSATMDQRRFQLVLLALFAATALITASIGIYGVIAHSLAQRSGEIGIRMALGAQPGDVHRLVLREGLTPVGWGIVGGIGVSIALGRVFGSLLFEVRATDPITLAVVAVLLVVVAAIACYVPARRATAIGAVAALRLE